MVQIEQEMVIASRYKIVNAKAYYALHYIHIEMIDNTKIKRTNNTTVSTAGAGYKSTSLCSIQFFYLFKMWHNAVKKIAKKKSIYMLTVLTQNSN